MLVDTSYTLQQYAKPVDPLSSSLVRALSLKHYQVLLVIICGGFKLHDEIRPVKIVLTIFLENRF